MATFPEDPTLNVDLDPEDGSEDGDGSAGGSVLGALQPRFEALGDILQPFAILLTALVNLLTVHRLMRG